VSQILVLSIRTISRTWCCTLEGGFWMDRLIRLKPAKNSPI
jgi:hypothetical protein